MPEKLQIPQFIQIEIKSLIDLDTASLVVLNTASSFNIKYQSNLDLLINFEKTNNFNRVNKFHEIANKTLKNNGYYISCAETEKQRKKRKWDKHVFFISPLILFVDFVYKRVWPKLPIFKQIYFALTRGYNRVMSKTELMGRLVSCGFKTEKVIEHNKLTYFISKKVGEPLNDMNPSYGPIFKMRRVGYQGEIISVFKFRTMSPYSEYVQEKVISENSLDSEGKIKDDYRITFYGKFLRRYWIDEIPMIINWIKRDVKLVGVRPLSEDYFSRYPKELQQLRINTKPGLIPPYYVDLPVNFEEICDSENKYLVKYFNNPIKTDCQYFFKAIYNIFIKRKRSH